MRQKPVQGWTVTLDQLGLPPGAGVTPLANIADLGVFLGVTDKEWSVLGVDASSGRRTFGPIPLGPADSGVSVDCYVNGPPTLLCVRDWPDAPSTAKVIDTVSGTVEYDGPTAVRADLLADQPHVEQVGDYALAVDGGKGIHGIGPRGELTWFVPGAGILNSQFTIQSDDVPSPLAVQGSGQMGDIVFSTANGSVVKPEVAQDVRLGRAMVYPGGFAHEYVSADDFSTDRVAFFDNAGRQVATAEPGGQLETRSVDLPLIRSKRDRRVFTVAGRMLLDLPPSVPATESRVIGDRLFVSSGADDDAEWEQYDLNTADAGATCKGQALGYYYLASDGEVVVASGSRVVAQAVDLSTCRPLWSISAAPNESIDIWRVNTTLVQRTNDTLFSLVAPS